jgi:DNA-binding transcriptional LysR family regulator
MAISELDLNLLKALQALLDTRSVTQTGERLGLSQPAASRIVSKLRAELNDPLLVRTAKGYVLTPRAVSLELVTRDALSMAQRVFESIKFEPEYSDRIFRIATTDYGLLVAIFQLSTHLEKIAPRMRLSTQPWNDETLSALERGSLDIALYADDPLPADFHCRDLYKETYAVLMRKGHPLLRHGIPKNKDLINSLADYPQVVASYPSGRQYLADDVLSRLGGRPHHVAIETPYFLAAPCLLKDTDRLMLLPKKAAEFFAKDNSLEYVRLPADQFSFSYRVVWHERAHRDPSVSWLRQQILAAFR